MPPWSALSRPVSSRSMASPATAIWRGATCRAVLAIRPRPTTPMSSCWSSSAKCCARRAPSGPSRASLAARTSSPRVAAAHLSSRRRLGPSRGQHGQVLRAREAWPLLEANGQAAGIQDARRVLEVQGQRELRIPVELAKSQRLLPAPERQGRCLGGGRCPGPKAAAAQPPRTRVAMVLGKRSGRKGRSRSPSRGRRRPLRQPRSLRPGRGPGPSWRGRAVVRGRPQRGRQSAPTPAL